MQKSPQLGEYRNILMASGDQSVLKSHFNLYICLSVPSQIRSFFQIKPYYNENYVQFILN